MNWNITAGRPVYVQLIEQLELALVGQVGPGQRCTAQVSAVDEDVMFLNSADGLRQVGHASHRQAGRCPGAGFHHSAGHQMW